MNTEIVAGPTAGGVRVERLITSGVFALDGGEWEVDNNVWIVGNDNHCIVIDAAHDPDAILAAIGDRELTHIVCTHAHNDHIDGAPGVAQATGAPIHLHPADRVLWELTFPDTAPDADLADGQRIPVGDVELEVRHTPGHAPGAVCLYAEALGVVFTGDTLFNGSVGRTDLPGGSGRDLIGSIMSRLMVLDDDTRVLPGHGEASTIGVERRTNPFLQGLVL